MALPDDAVTGGGLTARTAACGVLRGLGNIGWLDRCDLSPTHAASSLEVLDMLRDRDPEIAGRMVLQFTIMGDEAVGGIVEDVSFGEDSEIRDPSFRECLAETMRSTVFAPPEGGGRVVVRYPFVFENPDRESSPVEDAAR